METKIITTFGSILKTESLIPVQARILHNTTVAEANKPYSRYYDGNWPTDTKPNSLFLFTKCYYSLDEILRFSQGVEFCRNAEINVASSVVDFYNEPHPAIRIKHFPDYEKLEKLQECLQTEGVVFEKKSHFPNEASIRTTKCFRLEVSEKDLFMDLDEINKGYIEVPFRLNVADFNQLLIDLRANADCCMFDAVRCGIVLEGKTIDMIRIFSVGLKIDHLWKLKKWIEKMKFM